jgi:hypothetical protein
VAAPPEQPQTPPGAGSPLGPIGLDYFATQEPDRKRARSLRVVTFCLLLGWVPYLCGIVNVLVAAQSYSPAVVGAHRGGATLFIGLGLLLTAVALAGFVRLRHGLGAVAAFLLLGVEASIATCLAVSNF